LPAADTRGGDPVQAFTAIGRIRPGEPYVGDMGGGFHPIRRDVDFLACHAAPVRPLLDRLDFTRGHVSWGMVFRRGSFAVSREDFLTIAAAMGVREAVETSQG